MTAPEEVVNLALAVAGPGGPGVLPQPLSVRMITQSVPMERCVVRSTWLVCFNEEEIL